MASIVDVTASGHSGQATRDTRAGVTRGGVRSCLTYADEQLRSRVITADGQDFIVTTSTDVRAGQGYLTGAYPVSRGYLVMMRQPLCEFHHSDDAEARVAPPPARERAGRGGSAGLLCVRAPHSPPASWLRPPRRSLK